MSEPKPKEKPFAISKWVVVDAYEKVKANRGAAGVDGESIAEFERDLMHAPAAGNTSPRTADSKACKGSP